MNQSKVKAPQCVEMEQHDAGECRCFYLEFELLLILMCFYVKSITLNYTTVYDSNLKALCDKEKQKK